MAIESRKMILSYEIKESVVWLDAVSGGWVMFAKGETTYQQDDSIEKMLTDVLGGHNKKVSFYVKLDCHAFFSSDQFRFNFDPQRQRGTELLGGVARFEKSKYFFVQEVQRVFNEMKGVTSC